MRTLVGQWRAFTLSVCLLGLASGAAGGATLSITPGSVSNSYSGVIAVQIGGLTNAETVLLERFVDANGNGTIDPGEPVVQSFRLTDGQVTSVGGVRNLNVPGDSDLTANGQIAASLSFSAGAEFSRSSSAQLFRLSSPGSHFSPVTQPFTVTQSAAPQRITGTVSSGGSPISYAFVGVLVQVGSDMEFVSGTVADSSGHFSLNVTNGGYQVVAFMPGYVGSFATSPQVLVSGSNPDVTVPLTAGNLTLAGKVLETSSGSGIAGVQFFTSSGNGEYCILFSDSQGNFNASLIAGQWQMDTSDSTLFLGGYFRVQGKAQVNLTGNVSGFNIPLTSATALIYGTLRDDQNQPLPGVRLYCSDTGNLYQSGGLTDANGNFFCPATNGVWYVGADNQGSGLPADYTLQGVQTNVSNGQAVQLVLVAHRATAHLVGVAKDGNNNPISGGTILAFNTNFVNVTVQLGNDGSFSLPVSGGPWTISLENQTASLANVVAPQITFNVTDGVDISGINYVAPFASRGISGWVKTAAGNTAISGLNVYAFAQINGTNYQAGANTDSGGNYSLPVLPGVWSVGLDSQALAQRGYGTVFNQTANTSSGNQTLNFSVGGQPVGMIWFRHNLGIVGEFGANRTPNVTYPVSIKNYRVFFRVFDDTNPPAASTVLFTGPPGSGLTNAPADPDFGVVQDGTNVYYASPAVRSPSTATGGPWSVSYRNNPNNFDMQDPQAYSRAMIPLPMVTVSNDRLQAVNWTYKTVNGGPISGTPAFVTNSRIDLLDQNGNALDSQVFAPALSYTYPTTNVFHWSDIGVVRMNYSDDLGNQFFVSFSESSPTLSGASLLNGQRYQFELKGVAGQNYTIQYSTNLANPFWNTLVITNFMQSPIQVLDPYATNSARFYRVLLGP